MKRGGGWKENGVVCDGRVAWLEMWNIWEDEMMGFFSYVVHGLEEAEGVLEWFFSLSLYCWFIFYSS